MAITVPAAKLLGQIAAAISSVHITRRRLAIIQRQVQAPPRQEECVIESLFRCVISADIQREYEIPRAEVPLWINSSHSRPRRACLEPSAHDHLRLEDDSFAEFQRHHGVDFYEEIQGRKPALRRADLFVIAADGPVSIEFKYLKPGKVLNKDACLRQMSYYAGHSGTLLIIYAAKEPHPRLPADVKRIREDLQERARVVLTSGPPIVIV